MKSKRNEGFGPFPFAFNLAQNSDLKEGPRVAAGHNQEKEGRPSSKAQGPRLAGRMLAGQLRTMREGLVGCFAGQLVC